MQHNTVVEKATLFGSSSPSTMSGGSEAPKIEALSRSCKAEMEPWMEKAYASKAFEVTLYSVIYDMFR